MLFNFRVTIAFLTAFCLQSSAWGAEPRNFKPVTKDGRPYSIRVTTGMHEVSGWERGLERRDPTLRHWTWLPIYSYDQAYIGANRKHAMPARPQHVYVKPNHVPLPVVSHQPQTVAPPRYVKPNKLPLPVVEHPVPDYPHLAQLRPRAPQNAPLNNDADQSFDKSVAAVLHKPQASNVRPLSAVPKSYGAYTDVYGRLHPPDHYGDSLASARLHGKLIAPKTLY